MSAAYRYLFGPIALALLVAIYCLWGNEGRMLAASPFVIPAGLALVLWQQIELRRRDRA